MSALKVISRMKFRLILWKNLLIRRRYWISSICEALIPVLLFFIIAFGRAKFSGLTKVEVDHATYNEQENDYIMFGRINHDSNFYYCPNLKFVEDLMYELRVRLGLPYDKMKGFSNEMHLLNYYRTQTNKDKPTYAMVFTPTPNMHKNLEYSIRTFEKSLDWPINKLFNSENYYIPDIGSEHYRLHGFMALQWAIDDSFIALTRKNTSNVNVTIQEFPYPPYVRDEGVRNLFDYYLPLVTLLSFQLLCPNLIRRIVDEKFTGIKRLMTIMGLEQWMLLAGWFIHAISVNIFSIIFITILMKVNMGAKYPLIEYADGTILFTFLLLYCISCICFCFAYSSLFTNPRRALISGLIVCLLTYFIPQIYVLDQEKSSYLDRVFKLVLALLPNVSLQLGFNIISQYELREIGSQWNNILAPANGGTNDISLFLIFTMLISQIFFYTIIAITVDIIDSVKYGSTVFYYLKNMIQKENLPTDKNDSDQSKTLIDEIGIQIDKICKNYDKKKVLDKIDLSLKKNQINILLGHNGAGKSTLMSIITGMIPATSGHIFMKKQNISGNKKAINKIVGYCPQENIHFLTLTVLEHLKFFAMLKGKTWSEAEKISEELLSKMNMNKHMNKFPDALSGGMKRKLNLAIALVGDPEVLIMDEPTSGLDFESRREIWDILLEERKQKTILLSTHFMEEADAIGDQIAIMDHGILLCYGTPMELRNKYDVGYNVTITLKLENNNNNKKELIDRIKTELTEKFSDTKVSNNEHRITFLLPSKDKFKFHDIFEYFENNKLKSLRGIEYDISFQNTNMEKIFIRAAQEVNEKNVVIDFHKQTVYENNNSSVIIKCPEEAENDSITCMDSIYKFAKKEIDYGKKFIKMKRWVVFKRTWYYYYLLQFIIALCLVAATLSLSTVSGTQFTDHHYNLQLSLHAYKDSIVPYSLNQTDQQIQNMAQTYQKLVDKYATIEKTQSVSESAIKRGKENILDYKQHLIVGVEFNRTNDGTILLNGMFSNSALHGAPISLNLLMNTILKSQLDDTYSITLYNKLLPVMAKDIQKEQSVIKTAVLWVLLFPLAPLLILSAFIYSPYTDNSSYFKHLLYMTGLKPFVYWLANFLFDFFIYVIQIIVIVIVIAMFNFVDINIFGGFKEIFAIFLLCLLHGSWVIFVSYLFINIKPLSKPVGAFILSGFMSGTFLTLIVISLLESHDEYLKDIGRILKIVFSILPQFNFGHACIKFCTQAVWNYNWKIMSQEKKTSKCSFKPNPCCINENDDKCAKFKSYYFGPNGIWIELLIMLCMAVLFYVVVSLRKSLKMWYRKRNTEEINDNTLRTKAKKVTVKYGKENALDDLNFEIKKSECFGLLGPNGAGKSTTFRMFAAEEIPTKGSIMLNLDNTLDEKENGKWVNSSNKKYLKEIGYCPQFDALDVNMTGRETLQLFAEFKNYNLEIDNFIKRINLDDCKDNPVKEYSGGNKRKLNLGISILAFPNLVLLDEPTSGVDPISRRKIWEIIKKSKQCVKANEISKKTILLASHNMDECEELCDNIAFLNKGNIKIKGTISEIKKKYEKGYTIIINIKKNVDKTKIDSIKEKLEKTQGWKPFDEHQNILCYRIDEPHTKRWSEIFLFMQNLKNEYVDIIEDYDINNTTLEEILLDISKQQDNEKTKNLKCGL